MGTNRPDRASVRRSKGIIFRSSGDSGVEENCAAGGCGEGGGVFGESSGFRAYEWAVFECRWGHGGEDSLEGGGGGKVEILGGEKLTRLFAVANS